MSRFLLRDEPMLSGGLAAYVRSATPAGDCADAETLAVYAEGHSYADERARIEPHVASCVRCQSHLAMLARSAPAVAESRWSTMRHWMARWRRRG